MTARLCYFDIETAPSLGWFFEFYKEGNIVATQQPWFMLSFSWKWAGERQAHVKALCDYPGYTKNKTDDSHLVRDLHKIFCEADVLIAHNGDGFDIKKTNTRFLGIGLPPPIPYKTIDTLKISRRIFKQDSNRLAALGQYLGLGGKTPHTGFAMWKACMDGDMKAWATMKKYNKRDTLLLEQVAHKLIPWCPRTQKMLAKVGA